MRKIISFFLSVLLLLSACLLSLAVYAEENDADEQSPCTFAYDFTEEIPDVIAHYGLTELMMVEISPAATDGYVTFTATGDDPYFKFDDAHAPRGKGTDLAYAVIKYRTTAKIGKGEFFTNRSGGAHWGDAGTHVDWSYKTDGEWHAVVIDCTTAWGKAANETLYAFRLDPLASGATAGDRIDIAFIRFYASEDDARAFAAEVDPSLKPKVTTYKIDFVVDGKVIYSTTYTDDGAPFFEPGVPEIPGKSGAWEPYSLEDGGDLTVHAVYTDTWTEPALPDVAPAITEQDSTAKPVESMQESTENTDTNKGCGAALAAFLPFALLCALPCLTNRKEDAV